MQLTNAPGKLVLPFANAGSKNTIPTDSQIGVTPGAASLVDGFPPLTRTPLAAGGVPPSGLDMNGILFELSAIARWLAAGGGFTYDATFAADTNVGGYPKGAAVLRTDGLGFWINTQDGNTTDPESAGAAAAGWRPDMANGYASAVMSSGNVTLNPIQYGRPIINITGALTADVQLIFPAIPGKWVILNNTTGGYTVTAKTATGSGVTVSGTTIIVSDGGNIVSAILNGVTPARFDNGTRLATTAWVKARGLEFPPHFYLNTNTTLTSSHCGYLIETGAASPLTHMLPAATVGDGLTLMFFNDGTSTVTLTRAGTDVISPANGSLTSIVLQSGDTLTLVSNGATKWLAVGGSAQLPYSGYSAFPVGATVYVSGNTAPAGFVKKNGALLSRASYPTLYAYAVASGNMAASDGAWTEGQFSPGDGSTTFRIPDERGRFTRAWDDSRGIDSGRAIGSSQADDLKSHTHTLVQGYRMTATTGSARGFYTDYPGDTTTTNATGGTETRPANIAQLACIKY